MYRGTEKLSNVPQVTHVFSVQAGVGNRLLPEKEMKMQKQSWEEKIIVKYRDKK